MKHNKIAIAGAGGLGSNLVGMLFDYGFNRKQFDYSSVEVDVYDDDVIDTKNLLHQNFKLDDVGKYKVEVLENRYVINGIKKLMETKDFKKYDVIFSCVDNMQFRKSLYEYGQKNPNLFWIDGRCTSRQGMLLNSKLPVERQMHYINDSTESGGCLLDYEKEANISHAIPLVVSGMMLQAFLNYIRDERTAEKVFMV